MLRGKLLVLAVMLGSIGAAWGWHETNEFVPPADGAIPGGGQLYATGSLADQRSQCLDCHVDKGTFTMTFAFTPPIVGAKYVPGRRYDVLVRMTNEQHADGGRNINGFNARFEKAPGVAAGSLYGDHGPSCVQPNDAGRASTVAYENCDVILGGLPATNDWRFTWAAPAAGAGSVDVLYGAVDGDANIYSTGDAVVMGTFQLTEGP